MPCAVTALHSCSMVGRFWDDSKCQAAEQGSKCHGEVQWAMEHGIHLHEEWYPSLSERSSFREFQARLFQGDQAGVESHGCLEPCCHDTLPGELCHEDATWAMLYGVNLEEFSHVYPSYLTNESSFGEFQGYLHFCYPKRCPGPCASNTAMSSAHLGGLECPDSKGLK
mmetsp:Transcript_22671/g.73282  ORF Transcript_22671/g.73282 Transcript_22671/m.73282 type:complete len:168 (-) Transcript_22671:356-859(-)